MESYRVEIQAALNIALADQNAEIDPVPLSAGGGQPQPELDQLSNILKAFNDQFGGIDWKDADRIGQVITELPGKVAADQAYQNARRSADPQNARIEHDQALERVIIELLTDHTELFRQFMDNPVFRKWLCDRMFELTYDEVV